MAIANFVWHKWEKPEGMLYDVVHEIGTRALLRYSVPGIPPISEDSVTYFFAWVRDASPVVTAGISNEHFAKMLWHMWIEDDPIID